MKIKIDTVHVQETPSYEYAMEDGVGTTWSLFAEAVDTDGRVWGHEASFDAFGEKETVCNLVTAVKKRGYINTDHWREGDAWEAYKTPQTWEEEKAAYYEQETTT